MHEITNFFKPDLQHFLSFLTHITDLIQEPSCAIDPLENPHQQSEPSELSLKIHPLFCSLPDANDYVRDEKAWPMILAGYNQKMFRTAYSWRSGAPQRAECMAIWPFCFEDLLRAGEDDWGTLLMGQQKIEKCSPNNTERLKIMELFWLRSCRSAANSRDILLYPMQRAAKGASADLSWAQLLSLSHSKQGE